MVKILYWGEKKKRQREIYHIPFPHIHFRNLASTNDSFSRGLYSLKKNLLQQQKLQSAKHQIIYYSSSDSGSFLNIFRKPRYTTEMEQVPVGPLQILSSSISCLQEKGFSLVDLPEYLRAELNNCYNQGSEQMQKQRPKQVTTVRGPGSFSRDIHNNIFEFFCRN